MAWTLASARTDVADFLSALIYVYTLLIFAYIILQMLFTFGFRPPFSRVTDVILTFLRDVCEPYLRLFRRMLPMMGPFDFSPIIAILVLYFVNALVVRGLIHG